MNKLKVCIIGAGIQGISNALFLQKKGFDVTIFDRENPGSPVASYGNATGLPGFSLSNIVTSKPLMKERKSIQV